MTSTDPITDPHPAPQVPACLDDGVFYERLLALIADVDGLWEVADAGCRVEMVHTLWHHVDRLSRAGRAEVAS